MTEIFISKNKKIVYENLNWNLFNLKTTKENGETTSSKWVRRNDFNYTTLRGIIKALIREEIIENSFIEKIDNIDTEINEGIKKLVSEWSKYVAEEDKGRI